MIIADLVLRKENNTWQIWTIKIKKITHKQIMSFKYLFRHHKLFQALLLSSDVNVN